MKKTLLLVAFCLTIYGFSFAQTPLSELEKVKKIKLLESTREDVKKLFDDEDENSDGDWYETGAIRITLEYSSGDCSDDGAEEWNIDEGKVTEINILFGAPVPLKVLKIELSKFERIKDDDEADDDDDDNRVFYDKEKGVSYEVLKGHIKNIKFTPLEKNFPALCNNENVREYGSDKEWLRDKLMDRPSVIREHSLSVEDLILSKNEVTADCPADQSSVNDFEYFKIEVETKGSNDPDDVVTYNYTVSGGWIVGTGANVVWDLNGVKPGKYTITAGVDNGCGVCGNTKTREVLVKECPFCSKK